MLPLIDDLDVECKIVRFPINGKFANIGRSIFICTNISSRSIIWMNRRGCINLIVVDCVGGGGGSLWNFRWNSLWNSLWISGCNSFWIRVRRMRTVLKSIMIGISR
jgi:hypothetical protein